LVRELERSFAAACERGRFRLTHYSIQNDHVHLIVEAVSKSDLASSMKSIGARIARAVNRIFARRGPVLADRFHLHVLRTPREVRNALAYVLLNARRHLTKRGHRPPAHAEVDPASSGRWFSDGIEDSIRPLLSIPRRLRRRARGSSFWVGAAMASSIPQKSRGRSHRDARCPREPIASASLFAKKSALRAHRQRARFLLNSRPCRGRPAGEHGVDRSWELWLSAPARSTCRRSATPKQQTCRRGLPTATCA
jgi:REP element-mobilizing transposase RayT